MTPSLNPREGSASMKWLKKIRGWWNWTPATYWDFYRKQKEMTAISIALLIIAVILIAISLSITIVELKGLLKVLKAMLQ